MALLNVFLAYDNKVLIQVGGGLEKSELPREPISLQPKVGCL